MLKKLILIYIILSPFNAFSSISRLQKVLKKQNNLNIGNLCEQIAFKNFKTKYPEDKYKVFKNIKYQYQNQNGELDLIVFSRILKRVILIGEVKCSKDIKKAAIKANMQLLKFKRVVAKSRNNTHSKIIFTTINNYPAILKDSDFRIGIEYIKLYPFTVRNKKYGFESLSMTYTDIQELFLKEKVS